MDTEAHVAPLLLSRSMHSPGDMRSVQRAARRGTLIRVGHGAYTTAEAWEGLRLEGRHLIRMRAIAALRPGAVFSHRSAALAWGMPIIGAPPPVPEVIVMLGDGARNDRGVQVHRTTQEFDIHNRDGLAVTSVDRTLVDVARRCAAKVSVPMLDAAIGAKLTTIESVRAELARGTHIGWRRAQWAFDLVDSAAGSPGESLSRVQFDAIGLPRPETQVQFHDHLGRIGDVDFWWRRLNAIGEFDGFGKYHRVEFTGGRSPGEVVYDEKRREDRLRATSTRPVVIRWGWEEALNPRALRALFVEAGIRLPRL
jgi:hypothetical protein